jgi:hypothetical protein
MRQLFSILYLLPLCIVAQFAPAVGQLGCSAIHKDSSIIQSWVDSCKISRGWKDILNKSLGKTTLGNDTDAVGHPNKSNGVVSLGDSGTAVCYFKNAIKNGQGYDFAVFENSFDGLFLELAFVEVSTNGINYARFPSSSKTDTLNQVNGFGQIMATKINNLAGKYITNYGTPFDLSEIQNQAFINIDSIHYIKLIDVVGSLQNTLCSRDKDGNKVNDPFPTPFPSSGFDLNAIGVIHSRTPVSIDTKNISYNKMRAFPNIFTNEINIKGLKKYYPNTVTIYAMDNRIIRKLTTDKEEIQLNLSELSNGIYFIALKNTEKTLYTKIIKQ